MKQNKPMRMVLCGCAAGIISGLLGTGGGMILVPMLCAFTQIDDSKVFPTSVSIILPICITALSITGIQRGGLPIGEALPYLLGSAAGGILAGYTDGKIPVKWLHRGLGLLILWGGVRSLC